MLALRIGGWANLAIAAGHLIALGWAWTVFRWVEIEADMRSLADQHAALPYVLTLVVAGFFVIFGLYALSAAGDVRRLPLLRTVIALVAVIYLLRAAGGIPDVLAGDTKQTMFAAASLLIGLCYVYGALALRRTQVARRHAESGGRHLASAPGPSR